MHLRKPLAILASAAIVTSLALAPLSQAQEKAAADQSTPWATFAALEHADTVGAVHALVHPDNRDGANRYDPVAPDVRATLTLLEVRTDRGWAALLASVGAAESRQFVALVMKRDDDRWWLVDPNARVLDVPAWCDAQGWQWVRHYRLLAMRERGVASMRERYVAEFDRSSRDFDVWGPGAPIIGSSALVAAALMGGPEPIPPSDEQIAATLAALLAAQNEQGAIYTDMQPQAVYETACALLALARAVSLDADLADDARFSGAIGRAQAYLIGAQLDETPEPGIDADEDYLADETDPWFGGWGYGLGRTDRAAERAPANLSTTNFALSALRASGCDNDDVYDHALRFLNRCQNARAVNSEPVGSTPEATAEGNVAYPGNDGGGIFSPGDSKAGFDETDGQRSPRSYGAMSHTLLKCYLLADPDLSNDSARAGVDALLHWLGHPDHLDFTHNVGMPRDQRMSGYLYLLHSAAVGLAAVDPQPLADAIGDARDWNEMLLTQLEDSQREDGEWANPADRWAEGLVTIATSYALKAITALADAR